jgi:calcium-dependent protein kinase
MGNGAGKYFCIYNANQSPKVKKMGKLLTKVDPLPEIKVKYNICKENINRIYVFTKVIGEGYFSKVKEAYKMKDGDNQRKYAIKVIHKRRVDKSLKDDFLNELSILETIDHPNIIRFLETYEDENNYYLVMEYLGGGDIFQRIDRKKEINEQIIAYILYKVISAINYCHSIGIVHRDIKPENILFSDLTDEAEVKIIDFGLSKKFSSGIDELMHSFIGTPYFVAPEVIKMKYDSNCDMWSIGATAFMLFTGSPPFPDLRREDVLRKIQQEEPLYKKEIWDRYSSEAKDFVKKLLIKKPNKRMTAEKALNHPFFQNINKTIHDKKYLNMEILTNLQNFQIPFRFKKLVLGALIHTLSRRELTALNNTFNAIDLNHEGFISMDELKNAFVKAGLELTEKELNEIINRIDSDKNGKLNYSEFLVAAVNIKSTLDNQRLYKLFLNFDINNTGYIDVYSLHKAILRSGREIENISEAITIMEEVCKDGTSKISYDDFYKIMTH